MSEVIFQNSVYGSVVTLKRDDVHERFISVKRDGSDELAVFDGLSSGKGIVAAQIVFGGCKFNDSAHTRMGAADWPVLWVQGDVCSGTRIWGTQAFTIEGNAVRRVVLGEHVVGSFWSDSDADYCLLAGILPADVTDQRGAQTYSCFEQMETALQQVGLEFSDVVRTWLYLDKLLDWYDEFNDARTRFFQSRGVFDRLVPASTGIGGSNTKGAALAAGALAIRPRHSGVRICEVASPLQCSATEYRSSFSRAVEVAFPDHRTLLISGTASIAPDGRSMFADDSAKQINLTLDVIEAILESRGMDWRNTTRAVGYFYDMNALPIFEACCRERGIFPLPIVPVHAVVCRADLLFEVELDAIAKFDEKGTGGLGGAITQRQR